MNTTFHEQRLAPRQAEPHEQRVRRLGAERLIHERRAFAERPQTASRAAEHLEMAGESRLEPAAEAPHGAAASGRPGQVTNARHGGDHATRRHSHPGRSPLAGLSRAAIHARHVAGLEWRREEQAYRLDVRQWRQALRQRERLLRKLLLLERRLEKLASGRGLNG
ncbi:MAG TPA: hypothetical protein VFS62_17540 [Chloroflexota bacterium]|jgi:hypothetical protein|nr:hypothetical protein [Chloroflexota bacterium]